MKVCPKCGAEAGGVFCINCGAAVNDTPAEPAAPVEPVAPTFNVEASAAEKPMGVPAQQPVYTPPAQPSYTAPQQPYGGYQAPYYPPAAPQEQPVSVGGWIGRNLIPYIPFVGSIIYFIMLFVWMGDKSKEASFRNWAKAQLVMMGIAVGLVFVFFLLMLVLGLTVGDIISEARYY